MKITTIKSGQDYRAIINGQSYRFMLNSDRDMVQIYTPTSNLGGYYLSRFGGALSPAGIREFIGAETTP